MKIHRTVEPILFTKGGFEALKKDYAALLASRPAAVEDLRKAREMGDLRENGWYKAAKQKLVFMDRQLREMRHQLRYGQVREKTVTDIVDIGSTVTVSDGENEIGYAIVGEYEGDPGLRKLSNVSPLGRALIGKRAGEVVTFQAPAGEKKYTIKKIS